ncbi:nucleotidyltransferase family protein [Natronobacterium texcoconense]|uniref:Molybdenum cofactor cytidylyltransferase n=1 Tax=Natronobacterium texcoconense TaxID=1095778 RepID=A0A1H1IYE7_NATTX|nr:nucleotidyltransferase family protein [Natronobacterium texcoconense]SDR42731.1 molybdenum cofactor cytidylyltransferase [Natronobacterium texcoconense]
MSDGTASEPPADADLPVVEPPFEATDDPRVGGVVLAGGTSDRFGDRNKLLASLEGAPLVAHAARTLLETDVDPVVVVVGYEADRVQEAVSELPVTTVSNPTYEAGQSTSVRSGVETLRERTTVDAAVIALGDMPFVDPSTVDALVSAYASGAGDALAPAYESERGNPVLFDRRFFDLLTAVEGDVGGRRILLEGDSSALVAVDDPGVCRDVDRPNDLSHEKR